MKVYGPFRGINNPLIMGMFGLQVLDEGLKIYQAHHEAQQRDLLAHSLTSGQVEPSEPGGPFRQGLSKLTGGFISPDVQADPETLLTERKAQREQEAEKLKTLTTLGGLRKLTGPEPFKAGGPFSAALTSAGANPDVFAGQTPEEQQHEETRQHQKIMEDRSSPEGKAEAAKQVERAKIAEESSPAGMNLFRNRAATTASASSAARLEEAASPLGLGLKRTELEMAADVANDKTDRREQRKKDALDNTPVSEVATNKTSGGVYVRRKDLKLATGATGEPATKKEADSNPDYMFVPNKQVDGPGGLKDTIAQVHKVDEMLELLNSGSADKIFPSGKNKNWAALKEEQLTYGTTNNAKRSQDPVRNKWYNMYADLVRYYTGLQHRFPNTKELSIPLTPDPGGLVPSEHPILHLGGVNPLRAADTKEVAQQKLKDMRDTILGHFSTGAGIGTLEGDDEDAADFTAAARKAGAMK